MKRFRNLFFALAGLLVVVITVALATGGRTLAQITTECIKICDEVPVRVVLANVARIVGDVRITNDSDTPIPTRLNGAVLVDSSAQNAVRTRSALQVTDVFQREVVITLEPGQVTETASFFVPQSRLLVIETASGFAQMGTAFQSPVVVIKTVANGDEAQRPLFAQQGGGGWILTPFSWGPNFGYADPASKVEVKFVRLGASVGTAKATVTLTGHYVDQ
jgi:hypothetical protein